ncbi:hypothetical protein AOX55_00001073 [Sinorhizobium fredii CCBAU 25509]|nr:hypothetical protein AOX55_00001073 [Sinorhizobium fredii CCBAU 25509]
MTPQEWPPPTLGRFVLDFNFVEGGRGRHGSPVSLKKTRSIYRSMPRTKSELSVMYAVSMG